MTEVLPEIKVTNSQSRDLGKQGPLLAPSSNGGGTNGITEPRPRSGVSSDGILRDNGKTGPNQTTRDTFKQDTTTLNQQIPQDAEARRKSQAAIDPLSHHILKRTNTESLISQKMRTTSGLESTIRDPGSSGADATQTTMESSGRTENFGGASKDKKKGVKFLSRFIGSKKKDSPDIVDDDESEQGDPRTEGMDAHVFSQPIAYGGYIPRFPPPPKYIKVRSHNKKEKDFNRVFLAQELQSQSKVFEGDRKASDASITSSRQKISDATWALEFSIDGKYLAAGGQDKIVRVWAVISTAEERLAHEREEDATLSGPGSRGERLNAPVFKTKTIQEYQGHTADVLDLSWSKNNFLLSSSMDKTVRLWHVSRIECLCCFKHSDFVTSVAFHPRDDRFFLAGSLDSKLRLWSIPDKTVAFWNQLPDLITAVSFLPDGRTVVAGCLNGLCLFYETEGLKYHTQIHVRSTHGRNAKGSKITGIKTMVCPPDDPDGEVKLLITSNDSRIRLYNARDKALEMKFKGNENTCSQIHANFSDDAKYVVCGSEDRKVFIWSTEQLQSEKKDKRPVETFESHSAMVTTSIFAPTKTRQLLGNSGDPLYDLCNPPPVTLVSRTDSQTSARPPTENGNGQANGDEQLADADTPKFSKPRESPGYAARSVHSDGNVIVTADYMGRIKVFRQDCAYQKRRNDSWETGSTFSKKVGNGFLGRSGSIATRTSSKSRRSSMSNQQPSDRILDWRNSIASNGSLENSLKNGRSNRSVSPRKSIGQMSFHSRGSPKHSSIPLSSTNPPSISTTSPPPSIYNHNSSIDTTQSNTDNFSIDGANRNACTNDGSVKVMHPTEEDPLMLASNGQSHLFWNMEDWKNMGQAHQASVQHDSLDPNKLGLSVSRRMSTVSALTSEEGSSEAEEKMKCKKCESSNFSARRAGKKLVCTKCVLHPSPNFQRTSTAGCLWYTDDEFMIRCGTEA
ncbi:MAG: hypothetical protein M1827_001399 [Pycnora praestabilis]|nr:MAG: hypothetical protein M1827_001399 [Pycnora praestabilis]